MNSILRVGIIGTGWIAEKAAITLNGLAECDAYAVGSRTLEKAEAFANKWNIAKAYGSYAELIADPDIDFIYVGTPHSHHFDVTREALLADKPCLVEKAFMANARQTEEILANVQSSAACVGDNIGVIAGTEGNLIIDNINNPQTIADVLGAEFKPYYVSSSYLAQISPKSWDFKGNLLGDKACTVVFDCSKLKRAVPGFYATTQFHEGVRHAIDYILAHPEAQTEDSEFDVWCDLVINAMEKTKMMIEL